MLFEHFYVAKRCANGFYMSDFNPCEAMYIRIHGSSEQMNGPTPTQLQFCSSQPGRVCENVIFSFSFLSVTQAVWGPHSPVPVLFYPRSSPACLGSLEHPLHLAHLSGIATTLFPFPCQWTWLRTHRMKNKIQSQFKLGLVTWLCCLRKLFCLGLVPGSRAAWWGMYVWGCLCQEKDASDEMNWGHGLSFYLLDYKSCLLKEKSKQTSREKCTENKKNHRDLEKDQAQF